MTDIDQGAELEPEGAGSKRSPLKFWGMIGGAALLLVIAAGGVWYFLLGGRAELAGGAHKAEAPLPQFVQLKPFVVTIASRAGPSRFVQLGVSFEIPGPAAAAMINAVLPEVQDALRRTVLGFKAEDMQTPAGLDKLRVAIRSAVNAMLAQVLGPERIQKAAGGGSPGGLVQQVEFSTLVVE